MPATGCGRVQGPAMHCRQVQGAAMRCRQVQGAATHCRQARGAAMGCERGQVAPGAAAGPWPPPPAPPSPPSRCHRPAQCSMKHLHGCQQGGTKQVVGTRTGG